MDSGNAVGASSPGTPTSNNVGSSICRLKICLTLCVALRREIPKMPFPRPASRIIATLILAAGSAFTGIALGAPEHGGDLPTSIPDTTSMPNWTIQRVSDQVKNATALCLDDQGRIYVCETYRWREGIQDNRDHTYWIMDDLACETVEDRSHVYEKWKEKFQEQDFFTRFSDRVVRLEDHDGDGRAETLLEFASGFNEDVAGPAIGLLAGSQGIYLTCIPHLWLLKDVDGDGQADDKLKLLSGFGVKTSLSGHDLHGLAWGPDGKLYFSMGDRGFNCRTREGRILKDTNAGAVFRCNPDGSDLEIFYHQLRNPQELAFNEYGDLFTVDNNCDQGDSARICYLLEGGNTGWHLGAQAQTTYAAHIQDGGMEQVPHWLSEGIWKLRFDDQPAHILPPIAHLTNGPAGLAFNSGIGFPNRYQNHFLVCDYKGAPNLCFLYSFKVRRDAAGYAAADEHIVRGGIPVTDVAVGYNGKIYVSDFGGGWVRSDTGNVYSLFDPQTVDQPDVARLTALFRASFDNRSDADLVAMLSHRDMRVRLRSQYALAARGKRRWTRSAPWLITPKTLSLAITRSGASDSYTPRRSCCHCCPIWMRRFALKRLAHWVNVPRPPPLAPYVFYWMTPAHACERSPPLLWANCRTRNPGPGFFDCWNEMLIKTRLSVTEACMPSVTWPRANS